MRDDFHFPDNPGFPARPARPARARHPIDIDSDVLAHFTQLAEEKGLDAGDLINDILRQEMTLALLD